MSDFDAALARARDLSLRYLEGLPDRKIAQHPDHEDLVAALGGPLADQGVDPAQVVEQLAQGADAGLVATNAGRFFGFVEGGVLPAAMAADWLTSAWDQNPGFYVLSPAAAVVEETVASWILDLLGLPMTHSVGFTTGAQMAIVAGLAAGRHHVLARAGWDVEADGLVGAPPVRVIAGAECHVTVGRALRFLGLGEKKVTVLPAARQGRMDAAALRDELGRSSSPTIVVAEAGNVNSGSFDPLHDIATATREHGSWLHVDGAFGLWAAASPRYCQLVDGIELADSLATDGHKTLNVPYDSGIVICAHPESHRTALSLVAPYLVRADERTRNGSDWTLESSRRARAFALWAALRSLGRQGTARLVEDLCSHAQRFATSLSRHPDIEVLNEVVFTQVLFRVGDDDERTRRTGKLVQADGRAWIGATVWGDAVALRISVSDHATSSDDVDTALAAITEAAAASL